MIKEHVEQIADGSSAFFERTLSIAQLGEPVAGAQTSREALEAANLHDWNLRLTPLRAFDADEIEVDGLGVTVPGKRAVVRDVWPTSDHGDAVTDMMGPTRRALGVVGTKYELHSNEQTFGFLDDLVDAAGERLPFEYAGSLYDGRKVFVGLLLPRTISVGGFDDVQTRLLCVNSHDGTGAFTLQLHINRVPCTNAIRLTQRNAKAAQQQWALRHTSSLGGRVQQARESLQLAFASVDAFEAEAQQLIAHSVNERQFERLVDGVFPIESGATKRAREATQQTRLELRTIYRESPTQQQIKGTAWGVLNAFVEWADWARDVRPGKRDAADARALSQLDSRHVDMFKQDVHARVLALK